MDRKSLAYALSATLSLGICSSASIMQAAAHPAPPSTVNTPASAWHNDLFGAVQAQIEFAQTHVIATKRDIFDPVLVPHREALIIFSPPPLAPWTSVSMVVAVDGTEYVIPMAPPKDQPRNAVFDQRDTFSGNPIVGEYPQYRPNAWTATIPYYLFHEGMDLKFYVDGKPSVFGSLNRSKMLFLNSESEGLVLMNIKGCVFRERSTCRTNLEQFDMQKNPELATIAAREMFSELPVSRLVLGMGESHWPYAIAMGPDGRPHRYSLSDRDYHEWVEHGNQTLSAKLGMGQFWRMASDLGDKAPGKFVAISGQLLDAPDGVPMMPPGVGASCGGSNCNYPQTPVGYWHETGHGLGLPHWTPPRYEKWAYRSYDSRFLPNYHPAPENYGLDVDYLGYNYFGHIVGTSGPPAWPGSVASAPLVDEFEQIRTANPASITDWRRYIAPFTHQQTLKVQQRFGSFPPGLEFAGVGDDHRPPQAPGSSQLPPAGEDTPLIDAGIDSTSGYSGDLLNLIQPGEEPVEVGVPVQTLVVTMATSAHDAERVSQIYPPIISNYGNVFAPTLSGSMPAVRTAAETAKASPAQADDPQVFTSYALWVTYADGSAELRELFTGQLAPDRLIIAAVNVPISRGPVSAELFRMGGSVDKRDLTGQPTLPPPVSVGAELGYPVVTPQFLRSKATGKCLARTLLGLTQRACNHADTDQQWGMMNVIAQGGPKFVLTGRRTNVCLSNHLLLGVCPINLPQFQWSDRTDISKPEHILLQNTLDGLFITAAANGTVSASALSHHDDQNFRRTGPEGLAPLDQEGPASE